MSDVPLLRLNDGHRIPQLGVGTLAVPDDQAQQVVTDALRAGYRHIDTASLYGNEAGVGRAVAGSGLARDDVFVTTKLHTPDQGYDATLRAFDRSLGLLGLDHVDLYLIHWPAPARGLYVESWRALVRIRDEGRARSIGVSNFREADLRRVIDDSGVVPAVNQVELHPTFAQEKLRAVHHELGILTEAWSPLGNGHDLEEPAVREVARERGRSPAQVVIRWHLQRGTALFPKSASRERLAENLDVFDFTLDADEMAALGRLDRGLRLGGDPARNND